MVTVRVADVLELALLGWLVVQLAVLKAQLVRQEHRLGALMRELGVKDERYPPPSVHVQSLLKSQGMIAAIKQYRAETGLGLKESKDALDAFVARGTGA